MAELAVIVPTRGRPANAARLADAFGQTCNSRFTDLVFAVDDDDPELPQYRDLLYQHACWAQLRVMSEPRKIGPILNSLATELASYYPYIGFMGDDHLPCTPLWDEKLVWSLEDRPGVAYGNDLFQGENLPTAAVVSSSLISTLGYMCPPGLVHLFLDDFWKLLGQAAGNLRYLPDVVIEHLHPVAGKAAHDPGYAFTLDPATMAGDRQRFREFLDSRWHEDLRRLTKELRCA